MLRNTSYSTFGRSWTTDLTCVVSQVVCILNICENVTQIITFKIMSIFGRGHPVYVLVICRFNRPADEIQGTKNQQNDKNIITKTNNIYLTPVGPLTKMKHKEKEEGIQAFKNFYVPEAFGNTTHKTSATLYSYSCIAISSSMATIFFNSEAQ